MSTPPAFVLSSRAPQTDEALVEIGTALAHRRPLPDSACCLAFISAHHAADAETLSDALGDILGDIPFLGLGCRTAWSGLTLEESQPGLALLVLFDSGADLRAAKNQTLGSHTAAMLLADGPYAQLRIASAAPAGLDSINLLASLDESGAPIIGGLNVFPPGAEGAAIGSVRATWPATSLLSLAEHRAVVAVGQGTAPCGPERTCTRVDGQRVHEIDGRPAAEIMYQDLPRRSSPQAVPVFVSIAHDDGGVFVTQHVTGVDPQTGSLVVPTRVRPGSTMVFSTLSPEMARQDLEESLHALHESIAGQRPEAVLVFSCTARREAMLGTPLYDVGRATDLFGDDDVPVVGGSFAGELCTIGPNTHLMTYTAVVAALLKD